MKAKDLMIGDYIQDFTGDLCQVIVIDRQVAQVETLTGVLQGDTTRYLHEAEGVPLTPEILEKNFEQMSIEDISVGYQDKDLYTYDKLYRIKESDHYQFSQLEEILSCDGVMLRYEEGRFFIDVEASDCDFGAYGATFKEIHHVHELQHALRLCGIEKEIVL